MTLILWKTKPACQPSYCSFWFYTYSLISTVFVKVWFGLFVWIFSTVARFSSTPISSSTKPAKRSEPILPEVWGPADPSVPKAIHDHEVCHWDGGDPVWGITWLLWGKYPTCRTDECKSNQIMRCGVMTLHIVLWRSYRHLGECKHICI